MRQIACSARLGILACERGVAMLEFAFAGPLLLMFVLTGLEITNLTMAHLRVSQIAMSVADNAGRASGGIDEANIYEVFAGADVIGEPMDFEQHGRVVLSSLEPNGLSGADAGQVIGWQRCWGDLDVDPAYGVEGDGADDDELEDGLGPAGNTISAAANTALMFVEVTFDYQPLFAGDLMDIDPIRYETAFNVRGRENNAITNTQNLAEMDCD
jgi:TadE-like protein